MGGMAVGSTAGIEATTGFMATAVAAEDDYDNFMPHTGPAFLDEEIVDDQTAQPSQVGSGYSDVPANDFDVTAAAAHLRQRSEDSQREITAKAGCRRTEDSRS